MNRKTPKQGSNTGATIELVSGAQSVNERESLFDECHPADDPNKEQECLPDYRCGPDEEPVIEQVAPRDPTSITIDEDDCQDYGCCPKKPQQDCEPNV